MSLLTNWKTTAAGVLTILVAVAALLGIKVGSNPIDPATAIMMISAGWGLLFAKDANVTGGTTKQ